MENRETQFAKVLAETLRLAREQENRLTRAQIDAAFADFALDAEKKEQVYAYFRSHKVTIGAGKGKASARPQKNRARFYVKSISADEVAALFARAKHREGDAQTKLIEAYLPMVADIARLYEEQGVLREDLIGEGNMALVEGCAMLEACETAEEAEAALSGFVMNAMENLIRRTLKERADDEKTLARVRDTAEKAAALAGEYHRNLTVAEFLDETQMEQEELMHVLRLTGWELEGLELNNE